MILQADVSDPEQVEQAAQKLEEAFGPIDVWVNDAFCAVFSPAKEMTPADYKRVTEVSYLGFVYGTLAALKRMLPRDKGHDRASRLGPGLPGHPACSRPTAGPSTPSRASPNRCAAS